MALSRRVVVKKQRSGATWFERVMAAIALINLALVLFDLSYIRFRDQYLKVIPQPTVWYGEQFKGIEPERTTVAYLALVDALEDQVIDGNELTRERILVQLAEQSTVVVNEDPFAVAGKSGTLERIKNLMRSRMEEDSSKAAFRAFWNEADFAGAIATERLGFFNAEIRPLMETNYFRGIGETGSPIDLFWRIDIWFMGIFVAEFLARTFVLSRRHVGTTWLDAML